MRYLPKSPAERAEMLREIGASSIDDLFTAIPETPNPNDSGRNSNLKTGGRLTDRNSLLRGTKNTLTQIGAVSSRHLCLLFKEIFGSSDQLPKNSLVFN